MKLTTIHPQWQGESVAILASGPSLTQRAVDPLRGTMRVIAVNDQSFDLAPWADIIYGSDQRWWQERWPQVESLPGRKLALHQVHFPQPVECLLRTDRRYDERPAYLSGGGNSGYAALCLAVKLGAARVYLYGYDMRATGKRYRRKDYPHTLNNRPRFIHWIPNFNALAPIIQARGVEVINCTPGSALRCFPFAHSIDEAKSA